MRHITLGLQSLLAAALLLLSAFSHASILDSLRNDANNEFLPVQEAFSLEVQVQPGSISAQWRNAPGYYLYQHRIFVTQRVPLDPTVPVQSTEKITPSVFSKTGKEKFDEAFGDIVAFYGDLSVEFDTSMLQPGRATLHHQGCADAGLCYPPQTFELTIQASPSPKSTSTNTIAKTLDNATVGDSWFAGRSTLAILGVFFLLGLGLTFTPCVLPMIPILTTVVLGQNRTSPLRGFWLSLIYVTGMALTYAAAGLAVGLLGAGANVQAMMQTPWVLIVFALLFIGLALSMFGVYDLQLPAGLRNRLNAISQAQRGGQALSVFIIGALSALIVSPCVSAPLAGALAYLSTTGDAYLGGAALLALGFGMGTPLIVLGTTGASILPKAGPWMERMKAFFGFLLIGVAIWLISRLLPGPIVLACWGVLAIAAGVNAGALRTAKQPAQIAVKYVALMVFIYGCIAVIGAVKGQSDPLNPLANVDKTKHVTPFDITDDVSQLTSWIEQSEIPVMVDLYADWCISCKVMEKEIFANPIAQEALAHVRWLQLDMTDNTKAQQAFLEQQAVFGPPTVLFFEPKNSQAYGRIVGEREYDEFLNEALSLAPQSEP
ncbi:MAG: protein-disulfide reductase DsbD [Oleibacter sp.]|nr:protein-disulfide reductase DsbD [Thalassolituus sp.]